MGKPTDLVQGTVDLLILKTIAPGPIHGWAVAQRIKEVSNDVLKLNQNALYPALHRLEEQGWLKSEWRDSENNRRARYYSLTKAGRKRLGEEVSQWRRLSSAIELVVSTA
jgi:PadR family transcriptional regulator PadR